MYESIKKIGDRHNVICPKCGNPMKLRETTTHRYRSGRPHLFYSCVLWPLCDSTIGSDPKGRPQGVPADQETKELRIACHRVFDEWWRQGRMTRRQAYKLLQELMQLSADDAHFGRFNADQCREFLKRAELWDCEMRSSESPG
jgi:ssDNA-binding Zn-finger/Zn-ribbon topoisomerase 1